MSGRTTESHTRFFHSIDEAYQLFGSVRDNLAGSMTILQSAVDGVKLSLGSRLSPYIRSFVDWLTGKMPAVEGVISSVMDTVDGKIGALKSTIAEFTSSDEWANADIWGRISIAWDKVVAEPFSAWWDSTGRPWLTEKVVGFGSTLGSGISSGLLALLGFDASGAVADGASVGSSFIEGFKSGFDTEKITEALAEWAHDHKGVVAAAGLIASGKLLGGMAQAFQTGKSIFNDIAGMFGRGSSGGGGGGLGSFVSTMTISAGTVILNGSSAVGDQLPIPGFPNATGTAGTGSTAAGILSSATSWLGGVAGALGSGATTATGAAAVGAGSIAGGIGGILGLLSAGKNLVQGIGKSREGDAKGAKDEYVTAGIKAGMVGTGAAAGAAIGSAFFGVGAAPGALIGAGIGGLAAIFGGDGVGKAISDATDEGGLLNKIGAAVSDFASKAGETVGGFFTETIPTFLTEQLPYAAGYVFGAASTFFTETFPAKWTAFWDGVGNFFTESIPMWWEDVKAGAATFFTETMPTKWTDFWAGVGDFVTETIPASWESLKSSTATFFTETIPNAWDNFWAGAWDHISGFFGGAIDTITGAFGAGQSAGSAAAGGKHAADGIMNAPHTALVAENGPEAIIPLGSGNRSRGMAVWEQAGDILGVNDGVHVGSDGGGIPAYSVNTPAFAGPGEATQWGAVNAPVNIVLKQENNIQATDGMSEESIVQILTNHARELVDDISDEMAEQLTRIFANMLLKSGA